jgi:hypothetical protein
MGATAATSSPPIAVPTAPGSSVRTSTALAPQVESYDEETFYCKAPYTTFESISKKFYNNENYAQALLLFNRNHPRRAAALWKDPPQLQEDMPIYIPPLRILEKHYNYAIKDYNPLPPSVAPPAAATTDTSLSSPSEGPRYAVRKPEAIREIARATLGNWERWSEIYTLNGKNFDPSRPLPVGAVLAMPGDARIPAENKP